MSRRLCPWFFLFLSLFFMLSSIDAGLYAAPRRTAAKHKWAVKSKSKAGLNKIKLIDHNGVTHASYTYGKGGRVVKAKGLMKPQGKGSYHKGSIPRSKPAGFITGKDHRGHSIPEAGVADQSTVNIVDNLTSQDGFTNLSTKKIWENDVVAYAQSNPAAKVTTTHTFVFAKNGRPTVYHNTMKVNGIATAPSAAFGASYSFGNP